MNSNNLLLLVSRIGLMLFTVSILMLHFLQPEVTFLHDAMSYYVHGSGGWLLPTSLAALGLGSLALSLNLFRSRRIARSYSGIASLALWGIFLLVASIFPTDPMGSWAQPPTANGMIHFAAAILAFVFLVAAVLLLTPKLVKKTGWSPLKKSMVWLASLTAISFILLMVSICSIFASSGAPWMFGLTERLFIFLGAGWIAVALLGLRRSPHITGE